ncbi:MAG: NTP transferase domain-containing protein [Deltaproteobacteria bacterium]|nr:NTP transferase domain-containing protein [Deltaproteobacteria bacterium]
MPALLPIFSQCKCARGEGKKRNVSVVILAAGKGTRMKSDMAKVLHSICGRPMLAYTVDTARAVGAEKIVVVVGHQSDAVREAFAGEGLTFVEQRWQLGTAHAILQTREQLPGRGGTIIILCGDVPLLRASTVRALFDLHVSEKATVTVLTTIPEDPFGYGRIVKGEGGEVLRIVEEKDATAEEKKIREINTGIYCVESGFLYGAVAEIGNDNAQGEYYLTDIIGIAGRKGARIRSFIAADPVETMGINTPDDLERASIYKKSEPAVRD